MTNLHFTCRVRNVKLQSKKYAKYASTFLETTVKYVSATFKSEQKLQDAVACWIGVTQRTNFYH